MKAYPVGAATYSKHPDRYPEGAPQYTDWAKGAWVNGENGRLVDLTSGMGAVLLGHRYPAVETALRQQIKLGHSFPLPSRLEEQVAERLLSMLTWERAESVRFGKNGADVVTSAVRLARAVTGRQKVLYYDYHGHHDWCMTEPPWNAGVPSDGRRFSKKLKRGDENEWDSTQVAAIVVEGSSSVEPGPPPKFFFRILRDICDKTGTLLILDEMVTGFRMAPGGAAQALGIEPDLACYGKAMGNGMPISAIVGPWEYMKRYEKDVFLSLTHGGEALSLAAADATMKVVVDEDVPNVLADLGMEIIELFHVKQYGDRLKFGYPQRLTFKLAEEEKLQILHAGVLCGGYMNITLAHCTDPKARHTIMEAFRAVVG